MYLLSWGDGWADKALVLKYLLDPKHPQKIRAGTMAFNNAQEADRLAGAGGLARLVRTESSRFRTDPASINKVESDWERHPTSNLNFCMCVNTHAHTYKHILAYHKHTPHTQIHMMCKCAYICMYMYKCFSSHQNTWCFQIISSMNPFPALHYYMCKKKITCAEQSLDTYSATFRCERICPD